MGIRITRTSRAWSYPGYDSFIIYEYSFENVTSDTLNDIFITFANTFAPSMFGYQRNHGSWAESSYRGQPPNGLGAHIRVALLAQTSRCSLIRIQRSLLSAV